VSDDESLDIDLGYGAAIWGTVVDNEGEPIPEVGVHAVDAAGNVGATALTDDSGFYVLRVDPGAYSLVVEGRSHGRDPVLTSGLGDVALSGIEAEFAYGPLSLETLTGRVVDDEGQGLPFRTVRFVALELDGYGSEASWEGDAITNSEGNIDSRLLPGKYRVEVVAEAEDALSSASVEIEVDEEDEDIGTIELLPLGAVTGHVVDPSGLAVARTLIAVEESGFLGRIWQVSADDNGDFLLPAPLTPYVLTLTPPAPRTDLAITSAEGNAVSGSEELTFEAGAELHGTLRHPDEETAELTPSAFCIVEALDEMGHRKGVALTDSEGRFSMRVAD
jgi:hypothetical protein